MMEHRAVHLEIGGEVTIEDLRQLIFSVVMAGADEVTLPEFLESHPLLEELELHEYDNDGVRFRFSGVHFEVEGTEVHNEALERLECNLRIGGIPYNRTTEPGGGENGELICFRPNMGLRIFEADAWGNPIVTAEEWKRLREEHKNPEEFVQALSERFGECLPALPPLKIVDG